MNVETIQMDPQVAAGKLSALARMLKRQPNNEEWKQAQQGYRALERGTPLIDPFKAIRNAGWGPDGRPRLAMARADRKLVWFRVESGQWWDQERRRHYQAAEVGCRFQSYDGWRSRPAVGQKIDFTMGRTDTNNGAAQSGKAIVPMIPADVYPGRGHGSPKDWFILWEADWKAAPVDPMLLKPIGGNLYAVLAQWDLTPLERAILEGRVR